MDEFGCVADELGESVPLVGVVPVGWAGSEDGGHVGDLALRFARLVAVPVMLDALGDGAPDVPGRSGRGCGSEGGEEVVLAGSAGRCCQDSVAAGFADRRA